MFLEFNLFDSTTPLGSGRPNAAKKGDMDVGVTGTGESIFFTEFTKAFCGICAEDGVALFTDDLWKEIDSSFMVNVDTGVGTVWKDLIVDGIGDDILWKVGREVREAVSFEGVDIGGFGVARLFKWVENTGFPPIEKNWKNGAFVVPGCGLGITLFCDCC